LKGGSQKEQLRSMNITLKKENDLLEEERINLKSQLRLQALEVVFITMASLPCH
jgi:hypothetical protein